MNEKLVEKVWGGRTIGRLFGKKLPKGELIGECWAFYNKKYPIVLKLIDAKKPLSVQVHPPDKNGKSELWYIISAGKKTRVIGGIDLREHKVKAGDWVYLPGGTIHSILPPAVIFEVSQNKLVTYRLYDWGRGTRPLDIEEGIKAINVNAKPKIYRNINSFRCPYFNIRLLRLKKGSKRNIKGLCFVKNGIVKIGNSLIKKGEAVLVKNAVYALTKAVVFSVS